MKLRKKVNIYKCVQIVESEQVLVVAAGGIFDSRGLAMALSLGASGVWVGTRFVCAEEAGAPPLHQKTVMNTTSEGTARTIIFSGRPLRGGMTDYVRDWEDNRQEEIKDLNITSEKKNQNN